MGAGGGCYRAEAAAEIPEGLGAVPPPHTLGRFIRLTVKA